MLVRSQLPPRHLLRQLLPKPSNKTLLGQGRSHGTATPPSASPQAEAAWVALSPAPRPGDRSGAHFAAPNTRAQELSAGYQLGPGCKRRVISAARFLLPMGLQRWTEPSHLC